MTTAYVNADARAYVTFPKTSTSKQGELVVPCEGKQSQQDDTATLASSKLINKCLPSKSKADEATGGA